MKTKLPLLLAFMFLVPVSMMAEWIPLGNKTSTVTPPKVTLLSNTRSSTIIKVELSGFEINSFNTGDKTYQEIDLMTESYTTQPGSPELPYIAKVLAIPDNCGVSVEIIETGPAYTFSNIKLPPARPSWWEGKPEPPYLEDDEAYRSSQFYPGEYASMDAPSVFRDFRISRLAVYPVRYQPDKSELQVYASITVKVVYGDGEIINPKTTPKRAIPRSFAQLYQSTIFNYQEVLETDYAGQENGREVMLCIMPDALFNSFQVYATWKRQSGTDMVVKKFSEIGANATNPDIIKNYITQAYTTWANPPTYVLIVGDNGIFPKKTVTYPGYTFAWEEYFVCVAGNDYFPEMMIGRFTNQEDYRMQVMINKFLLYEKQPWTQDPSWFKKGICCSNNAYASQVETKRYAAKMMLDHGNFTSVDTMMSNGNSWGGGCTYNVNSIKTAINQGRSFLNYRGEGWSSGWNANCYNFHTSDVSSLNNGQKFTFVTSIGCGVAMFDASGGNCFGEEWVQMGTLTAPRGGVAFIGPTSNTHTTYNNRIDKGIYTGMFMEGMDTPGQAMARGKLYMYNVFGNEYYVEYHYKVFCVLGDPGIHIWKDVPRQVNATYPASVNVGNNSINFTVAYADSGLPVPDAQVCITGQGVFATGYTGANGTITIDLTLYSQLNLTVTVRGGTVIPIQGNIQVIQPDVLVEPEGTPIVTDLNGNNDGKVNPNETINIAFSLKNWGSVSANNVQATISSLDPNVQVITTSPISIGDLAPGAQSLSQPFQFFVSPTCPVDHVIHFQLAVSCGVNSWGYPFSITVKGCQLHYQNFVIHDWNAASPNFRMDPGETVNLMMSVKNIGEDNAPNVKGILSTNDPYITIIDSVGLFGNMPINSIANNLSDYFRVNIHQNCPTPYLVQFNLKLQTQNGFYPYQKNTVLNIPVTMLVSSDYTGPDAYGYYAYSSDDPFYDPTPAYEWIELVETGTQIELPPLVGDYTETVNLPFTFKYYGNDYNHLRISTDGWVAFGEGTQVAPVNTGLPNNDNVNNMVAVFWTDLIDEEFLMGKIYHHYDAANHRFIVEWDSISHNNTSVEPMRDVFQVILLDPAHHPTTTSDGEIIVQYKIVNLTETVTVGIENHTQDIGLQYVFNANYNPTASNITNHYAIKFTTEPPFTTAIVPGDANCDGNVNVLDAVVLINYIVGLNPQPFCFENSDLNNDGVINILDVVGTVNIILGKKNSVVLNEVNASAHIFMNSDNVELYSEGNLAGLQFDITGINAQQLSFALQGYEFAVSDDDNKLTGIIFSFDNTPIPAGKVKLFDISTLNKPAWGEVIAANGAAKPVEVFKHQNFSEENSSTETSLTVFPNPFSLSTRITYSTAEAGMVLLEIYDVRGELVRTLVNEKQDAGSHSAEWNELNNAGNRVASGVYFCRIRTSGISEAKMLLMLQ